MNEPNPRTCPNCGKPVPGNATLCPNCGKSIPPLPVLTGEKAGAKNEARLMTSAAWSDSLLGGLSAFLLPFVVGIVSGTISTLIMRNHAGEPLTLSMLISLPGVLGGYILLYILLHARYPVFGRVFGIVALTMVIGFPLGMLSNCLGALVGSSMVGGI